MSQNADVTIFDPATVLDRSTYREPSLPPVGIQYVLVNGVPVVNESSGRVTRVLAMKRERCW